MACSLPAGAGSTIVSVARTGELSLADGRVVRLAGIDWPSIERRAMRERAWQALRRLAERSGVQLAAEGRPDRWGRRSAQVFLTAPDGPPEPQWLQSILLSLGLVRAWPEPRPDLCWPAQLAAEERARRAGLGVWSPLARRAERRQMSLPLDRLSSRVVYEGQVRSVRTGRAAVFVNFLGVRDRTPAMLVRQRSLATWRKEGLDPATFSGKRLRVRGALVRQPWLRIDVEGPSAVEVLE